MKVMRLTMMSFGMFMGVFAIILNSIGVTLEFVYLFMGIAIGSAVPPLYLCVNWNKASSSGAVAGAIAGADAALSAFFGNAYSCCDNR